MAVAREGNDRVYNRIRQLLAVAAGTSNQEEAQAAAAKAQELMTRYELAVGDLEVGAEDSAVAVEDFDLGVVWGQPINWRRMLVGVLSTTNHCRALQHTGTNRMTLVGRAANVQVITYMYQYLTREIERLAESAFLDLPGYEQESLRRSQRKAAWVDSYYKGAVAGVASAIREAAARIWRTEGTEQSRALVVARDRKVDEEFANRFPHTRTAERTGAAYRRAYNQGVADGQTIQLNPGVGGSAGGAKQLGG